MAIEHIERLARARARAGKADEALELLEAGMILDPARALAAMADVARRSGQTMKAEVFQEVASWLAE